MSPAVPSTVSSLQRRVLRPAAVALRILFRLGSDAVIYSFLVTLWAGFYGGFVLMCFGNRHCGKGSAVEAFGTALHLRAFDVVERLFPVFIPMYLVRLFQRLLAHDQAPAKEEYKYISKKLPGLGTIIAALINGHYQTLLGDKFFFKNGKLPPYALIPMFYAFFRGITSQLNLEKISLVWRVGFVFCDVATFGFFFIIHFLAVRDMALLVTPPRARDASVMQ